MGKGKLMLPFSAECLQISAFHSPARWLYPLKPGGAEIHRRSSENGYINLPGPYINNVHFYNTCVN